jgi:hypothetical protein
MMATALDPARRRTVVDATGDDHVPTGRNPVDIFNEQYKFDPSAGTHGGIVRRTPERPGAIDGPSLGNIRSAGLLDPHLPANEKMIERWSGIVKKQSSEKKKRIQTTTERVEKSFHYGRPIPLDGSWQQNAEDILEMGIVEDMVVDDPILFGMTKAPSQDALVEYFKNRMGPFPSPDQK